MVDDQQGCAGARQPRDRSGHVVRAALVQVGGGLVEDQQPRVVLAQERARERIRRV